MQVRRFSEGRFSGLGEEHPQGCWIKADDFDRILAERDALQQLLNARDEQLAQQHQGESVAWETAERTANVPAVHEALQMFSDDPTGDAGTSLVRAVLEAVRADPAEVERLRRALKGAMTLMTEGAARERDSIAERDILRAQLAEAQALLQKVLGHLKAGKPGEAQVALYNGLSASAEPSAPKCETCSDQGIVGNILNAETCMDCTPSAPVEIDERADFEAAWSARLERLRLHERGNEFYRVQPNDLYRWGNVQDAWELWQARAALARKP